MEDKSNITSLLSEHYNDTCEIVRSRERRRERLLIIVAILLALIFLQTQNQEGGMQLAQELAREHLSPETFRENFSILKSALLAVLAILVHTYYQTDIFIERTYRHIHELEGKINSTVGFDAIYRDGISYGKDYPYFLHWTWLFYKWIVPATILVVTLADLILHVLEFGILAPSSYFQILVTSLVVISTVLYLLLVHRRK